MKKSEHPHTPGPWTLTLAKLSLPGGEPLLFAGMRHKIEDGNGNHIVECPAHRAYGPGYAPRLEECLANARLIACAPVMFEALKGFARSMEAGIMPELALIKAKEVLAKVAGGAK